MTAGRSAEEIVRDAWPDARVGYEFAAWYVVLWEGFGPIIGVWRLESEDAAWSAALAFTLERQKEVAEIEEEIDTQQVLCRAFELAENDGVLMRYAPAKRILLRLQAILAEKKRDMRTEGSDGK